MKRPTTLLLLLAVGLSACADRIKIEDEVTYGRVTVVKDWFTSAAVVQTDGAPVMIDAGFRSKAMARSLEKLDVDPAAVQAVLFTHGHGDHLGALDIYTGAELVGQGVEADLVAEEAEATIDVPLDGGTVLTYDGVDIEVIPVPGHTPGSAAYLIEGVLLLGDSCLIARDGSLEPVDEKRSDDPAQAEQSLRELAAALEPRADEIDWLVPSHSAASPGLDALLDYAAAGGG